MMPCCLFLDSILSPNGAKHSVLFDMNVQYFFSDVEDLTHKTGNFKQFSIFVSMLESAIIQVQYLVV